LDGELGVGGIIQAVFKTDDRLKVNQAVISPDLAEIFALANGEEYRFKVGMLKSRVKVYIRKLKRGSSIIVHPRLLRFLLLAANNHYGLARQKNDLMIGPVVGVMANRYPNKRRPFAAQSTFFSEMITVAKELGVIAYVFAPKNINWSQKTVKGFYYSNGKWIISIFPLPDVVYPRESVSFPAIVQTRQRMQAMGTKFINPPLIGKWKTFQILSHNQELSPSLPDTRLVKDFGPVDQMLKKYQAVYIKPAQGSQGRNIIRVVKKKEAKFYEYQYQLNHKMYSGKVSTIKELRNKLRRVMGNRVYIVQKQINLLQAQDKVIDVRIVVQKDERGIWTITGKACRVGRSGSITSNISGGGNASKVEEIIARYFKDRLERERIIKEIDRIALQAAESLEKDVGAIGEFGIDIGVDKDGRVWFIEANLKPARQVFNLIGDKAARRKSVEKPLLYARYLANF